MERAQRDVLASIEFQLENDGATIICIFTRVFVKGQPIQWVNIEEQSESLDNLSSTSSEDEDNTRVSSIIDVSRLEIKDDNLEISWQKFWSTNGEKLIWKSWINKYSDYINPTYLDEPKTQFCFDEKVLKQLKSEPTRSLLTRYLSTSDEKLGDVSEGWNPLSPLSLDCEQEAERLLSSRCGSHKSTKSARTVDSMTNVTRMTVSSVDIGSSQSSDSISSVSSVSSSEKSSEEDYSGQWGELWKQNYEEEYLVQHEKFATMYNDVDSTIGASSDTLTCDETEDSTTLMSSMGLPTSFGGKKIECSWQKSGNSARAAMNLIGIEYLDDENLKNAIKIDYKMKNIRGQNQRISLSSKKHHHSESSSDSVDDVAMPIEKRKRKKRKKKIQYPAEIESNSKLKKFWARRFSLFSRFDEGVKLDEESWYSVTPEAIAKHAAQRCSCDVIVDAFCGAGGNAIQLAMTCKRVIAIDIDPEKIELAKNNARVYGVDSKIDFIIGDFFHLVPQLRADAIFLSPPWGGMSYASRKVYDLETMLQPRPFMELIAAARQVSLNVAVFLPKNTNTATLVQAAGTGGRVEIEQDFIRNKQISITAYYNDLIK